MKLCLRVFVVQSRLNCTPCHGGSENVAQKGLQLAFDANFARLNKVFRSVKDADVDTPPL